MSIRCHPDANAFDTKTAASLLFSFDATWLSMDPANDYAADIPLLGVPEILGTACNVFGMIAVLAMVRGGSAVERHHHARRCFQWMLFYLLMHAAIHASWGFRFRVPFTAAMNIAFAWMRHHGFSMSWWQASAEKSQRGRQISEAFVYLLILFNLIVVSPRALTIAATSFLQPLLLWPLRFWVDDWRRPRHLLWLINFSVMWWTFSYFIKKEVQAGSDCTWRNTHLTAEVFGVLGNLSLVMYLLKVTKDVNRNMDGKSEESKKVD